MNFTKYVLLFFASRDTCLLQNIIIVINYASFTTTFVIMDVYKRLAYLSQMQSLLNDIDESKKNAKNTTNSTNSEDITSAIQPRSADSKPDLAHTSNGTPSPDRSLVKLNSFFGHLSKEIAMKHNIQM